MHRYLALFFGLLLFSCSEQLPFDSVEITEVISDSLNKVRAIDVETNGNLWFSAGEGRIGQWKNDSLKMAAIHYNSTQLKFKDIAVQANSVYLLHPTQPALVYKLDYNEEGAQHIEVVFTEENPNVFFNNIQFFDEQHGIIVGEGEDATCLEIYTTSDAGETWTKVSCDTLPKLENGEQLFLASSANLAVADSNVWITTGGKRARVLHSADYGKTWEVYNTPFIQGEEASGIFAVDFINELEGVIVGGKWKDKNFNAGNKAFTKDGGKTWKLFANDKNPGLQTQIKAVPETKSSYVGIGSQGLSLTSDLKTWHSLSDKAFEHLVFISEKAAYAAFEGKIYYLEFK